MSNGGGVQSERPGLLVVVSGPSGAGKGTVRKSLVSHRPDIVYAVSCTTRKPRPGEIHGQHYYFLSDEEFETRLESGQLVEWARVYGNLYGTPREPMESMVREGTDVIVEKDPQGAMTLKKRYPDAVYVFILPPSWDELRQRIISRGTESDGARRRRLGSVKEELQYVNEYDYVVINDDAHRAAVELAAIITAEKCRVSRNQQLISGVTKDIE